MKTRVAVVTPCRNAAPWIAETVESVLAQTALRNGRAELDYVIVDGASDDGTAEVAARAGGSRVTVVSEPDQSMYDALAKGLRRVDGAVTCYLNAGDLYAPTAFDVVLDVLRESTVSWLTGYDAYYNSKGHVIGLRLPFRYRRSFVRRGVYGMRLPAIQQETTFWRSALNDLVDLDVLASYRLAGDHYLWHRFASEHDLYVVAAFLGGFRYHGDHLSGDMAAYREEARRHASGPRPYELPLVALDRLTWRAPERVKKAWNPHLLRYDRRSDRWV